MHCAVTVSTSSSALPSSAVAIRITRHISIPRLSRWATCSQGSMSENTVTSLLREIGGFGLPSARASRGVGPLLKLLASDEDVTRDELRAAVNRAFDGLYHHPLIRHTERFTHTLRKRRLIPNEQSTEDLIRFVVEQVVARRPVPVPDMLVQEFWQFFNELFSSPELKG